ncbi:MAG TPA: glycerate dehydrogenase [Clostridiales bacterium]|nr:glycerate dehydrogenase [Clostridiales bacterium]HCI64174.1 glycerate dehydrogenase [Clostridiales bacterium]
MKIVILDGYALNPGDLSYDCLKAFGELTVYERTDSEGQAIARIGDAEIVLINKVPVTESLLAACPNIRLICVQATGYNVVDCEACKKRGILVTNVPSYGTAAVAQFTMALLLELCHQIGLHNRDVHAGGWEKANCFCYWLTPQMELAGKTMGIIGFGKIGMAVGKLAKAFGMEVLAYNRSQCEEGKQIGTYADLDTLLAKSDVVSLHCPLFPQTRGIINESSIAKMKDGAMLINTARGPLVEETALAAALNSGKLRGAALDVVSQEPINADSPLLTCKNCVLTPHIAWAPIESRQRLLDTVVENIRAYLAGKPQNVVNP